MRQILFLLVSLTVSSPVRASVILRLHGQVVSFDQNEISLETLKAVYRLDRKGLAAGESDALAHAGKVVTLAVPISGIKSVTSIKKN